MKRIRNDKHHDLRMTTLHNINKLHKLDPADFEYSELLGEICNANMGLVYRIVDGITRRKMEYNLTQDLIASGREGLIFAIKNFDPKRRFYFSPYASQSIFGYVQKFLNKNSNIPLPSAMAGAMAAARAKRVSLCKDKKSKLYGKYVFTNRQGVEVECDPVVMDIARGSMSIEYLNEISSDGVHEIGSEEFEKSSVASDSIKQALESLDERDQKILLMRYEQEDKFKIIAEDLKVSIARVQQLEQRAVSRFRSALLKYGVSV